MRAFERLEPCMGTVFRFAGNTALAEVELGVVLQRAANTLHKADAIFSLYKPESPLSRLARGETSVKELPPVVDQVWGLCEQWQKKTDGWFSAFTPQNTFDPSGLVKTWAAQYAADTLLVAGITDFTLNAGGDILISDGQSVDENWRIGISKPVSIASDQAGVITVLDLKGTEYRAVATSGSAERGEHIWNPRAGKLQDEVAQVTVIARDLVEADIWATAAFAEGARAIDRLNRQDNIEALFVMRDGSLQATDGLVSLLAIPKH
jgi:FAD:protein FMN transferase